MKTVILCGGLGTRISEETSIKPKPMIEIGGNPILWNIMKTYERHGFNDFVLALGYKGHIIKDYFSNYNSRNSDFTINTKTGIKHFDSIKKAEDWNVDLIDTGKLTLTGGRILRLKDKLKETFFLTYGDGVCNVDLNKLLDSLPVVINTYDDHRFAMSFAILGSFDLFKNGSSWLRISNPNCCAKTFPRFFDVLSTIRNNSTNS